MPTDAEEHALRASMWEPKWLRRANVHSRQAMSGDVHRTGRRRAPHRATRGYVERPGGVDLGAGGRGFESRHPDQRCRLWACCRPSSWPLRSLDRHLTVVLNVDPRHSVAQTGPRWQGHQDRRGKPFERSDGRLGAVSGGGPERAGIAIVNVPRRIAAFTRYACAVGVPDRSPT